MKHHAHHDPYHVTPVETYLKVFFGLIGLTVLTVGASYINFGGTMNIFVAMLIACAKASLVVLWFMHQKYENRMNRVIFFSTFAFLVIFFIFSWADIANRKTSTPIPISEMIKK